MAKSTLACGCQAGWKTLIANGGGPVPHTGLQHLTANNTADKAAVLILLICIPWDAYWVVFRVDATGSVHELGDSRQHKDISVHVLHKLKFINFSCMKAFVPSFVSVFVYVSVYVRPRVRQHMRVRGLGGRAGGWGGRAGGSGCQAGISICITNKAGWQGIRSRTMSNEAT